MSKTKSTSFRLSDKGLKELARIAAALGISQAAVLEIAIRKMANQYARSEK